MVPGFLASGARCGALGRAEFSRTARLACKPSTEPTSVHAERTPSLTPKCDGFATRHIPIQEPFLAGTFSDACFHLGTSELELELSIKANPPKGGDAKLPV